MLEWIWNTIKNLLKACGLFIAWIFFMAIITAICGDIGIIFGFLLTIATIIIILYKNRCIYKNDNKKRIWNYSIF